MLRPLLLALFLTSTAASAHNDMDRAPEDFSTPAGKHVFVDFTKATYEITYDATAKTAVVHALLAFNARSTGRPLFDLVAEPTQIKLDGAVTRADVVALPADASKVRSVVTAVTPGEHTLEVWTTLTQLVEFDATGTRSAFWTTDLNDRGYLERYLPANLEFDRVQMNLKLTFLNGTKTQRIYANGIVTATGNNTFTVAFPEYFTSSSVFFHTTPEGAMSETVFTIRSIDGRDLPAVIYKKPSPWGSDAGELERLKTRTTSIIAELESDYGPFLHSSVTIYLAGSGGMEYCGATMTDSGALGHELTHSYFARGLIPANGNAGWIDEALASWRDNAYPRATAISGTANMAGRATYTRFTDYAAYTYGARFMSYLDGKFAAQGGLKSLLRKLIDEKAFTPYFTEDFRKWAEEHYGMPLEAEFKRVYGGVSDKQSNHPIHRKMSLKEMREWL